MSAFTSSSLRSLLRAAPARSFSSSSARAMTRMNITGRLGADPELVNTQTGKQFVRYVVAAESGGANTRNVSWWKVAAFVPDSQRDFLMGLQKGSLVAVDADVQQRKWQDTEGQEQTTLSISQRHIELLRRPFTGAREGQQQEYPEHQE
ncbi:hypothetical protein BDV18DRAFT_138740 [Aspergillus unguis]